MVLEHYPVKSIRDIDISPGFFASGPWGAKLATVEGEKISLDEIEHRILRPIWKDPRIHYAVNCASLGCPNLQAVPAMIANRMIADVPIIIGSLDPCFSCTERVEAVDVRTNRVTVYSQDELLGMFRRNSRRRKSP